MNTDDINIILQEFESIKNISPSQNWDLVFNEKLNNARKSKSNKISKISTAVLILVFLNIGFVFNSFQTKNSKIETSRNENLKTIADELLSLNN